MANISEREIVGSIATILADIGLTADYSVDNSVIGKEFRRVVGDRFNRRLPREEVALQEIFCRIGKVLNLNENSGITMSSRLISILPVGPGV